MLQASVIHRALRFHILTTIFLLVTCASQGAEGWLVGVARQDITPDYPVRLSGYGGRRAESEGVMQRIYAKALAINQPGGQPAVLITVDNCGVPGAMRAEVLKRLAGTGITGEHFAIGSSHTHSAPMLEGVLPNLFSMDIPAEHKVNIVRYTRELTDKLEQVARAALKNRQPAQLAWGQGKAQFARNRRTPGGPVDHDVPVLRVTAPDGQARALLVNYACHCTTVTGEFNHICGDWAGYAQEFLERDFPGATVLTIIGCGADQNPFPRPGFDLAKQHGEELTRSVKGVLAGPLKPLTAALECRSKDIRLAFDTLPTREELEQRATNKTPNISYPAKVNLARLALGQKLPTELPYLVQTWNFGNELAMVFLPGEVVVDYSLRLKKDFDATRMWVNGYANDVPCYIPSGRVLKEGGYEGGGAMVYYDRPTRFAADVEDRIFGALKELIPKAFLADAKKVELPSWKTPWESLASIKTKTNMVVELVVAEPSIESPVAIDFGADGKLWVAEMRDYPMGIDGNWKPGGRVKLVSSSKGDGKFDQASVFIENLPFPTGVMAWRKGVLVCAAPDIIYAEDTNGDGKADVVRKVASGFGTGNYQARVNSLQWGLDNWVHGACGLFGGDITLASGKIVKLGNRDFRFHPETDDFEPASGRTQQGRVRDDWGNWFGCENSTPIFHFPILDHYLSRNPHVAAPDTRVAPAYPGWTRVHPFSQTVERFNNPNSANHVTSGCGLGIYRDELLGTNFHGDAFVCEPVHNLVHRMKLKPTGATFTVARAADEQQSEFFASADNWSRPVEACTGPDGALWVVDMYRAVIEHPRWIPPEQMAKLDARAGADKGRIYRVYPRGAKLRPIRDLTKLPTPELATALDTPNGVTRDLVHRQLVQRNDKAAVPTLAKLAGSSKRAAVRVQALSALDGLNSLSAELLHSALQDTDPHVRRAAVELAGAALSRTPSMVPVDALLGRLSDTDFTVRLQSALALGHSVDTRIAKALVGLLQTDGGDPWLRAAANSSSRPHAQAMVDQLANASAAPSPEILNPLLATALAIGKETDALRLLASIASATGWPKNVQYRAATQIIDWLGRKKIGFAKAQSAIAAQDSALAAKLSQLVADSRGLESDAKLDDETRVSILQLQVAAAGATADLTHLRGLLQPGTPLRLQLAALEALARSGNPQLPQWLLGQWRTQSPALRNKAIDALVTRPDWAGELLAAIGSGVVSLPEVSPSVRTKLLNYGDPSLKQRAAKLLVSPNSNRTMVVARYQPSASMKGDVVKGSQLFLQHCATCHNFRGQGFNVGATLNNQDKDVAWFLQNILDPNAAIDPRYVAYNVEMKDGRSLSGLISGESASSVTLIAGGGVKETVLRSAIAEMRASNLSLMPEGLEQILTVQDMADLITFLKAPTAAPEARQ
jgi:putative membrane-bound dehydrogenase-like protein